MAESPTTSTSAARPRCDMDRESTTSTCFTPPTRSCRLWAAPLPLEDP